MDSPLLSEDEFSEVNLSDFQKCVVQIRRISANRLGKLEGNIKKALVNELFCNYCATENNVDVFEGFLRLLVFFGKNVRLHEGYISSTVISAFYNFLTNDVECETVRNLILQNSFSHDNYVYVCFYFILSFVK